MTLSKRDREAAMRLARWRDDFVLGVRELWGAEPDAWQREGLAAFNRHQRLAFQACKGPGKSCLAAWCVWLFMLTRLSPKVVCTSITADNLRDCLWTELALWQGRSALLKRLFGWSASRIVLKEEPETWWCSARAWAKDASSEKQADTMAGLHGENVLVVMDEAGGIPTSVLSAADAALANPGGDKHLILLGNPTDLSGALHDAVTRDRDRWWIKEISGDPDDPTRSPRIDIEWARQQIALYGRDHPWVRVNVLGKFPGKAFDSLIGVDEVTAAMSRGRCQAESYSKEPLVFGLDVARFGGDRSVLFFRRGNDAASILPLEWRSIDNMALAAQVAEAITRYAPERVFIDSGGGAGVIDRLRQMDFEVTEVNFGGEAIRHADCPEFANKRSEMWWLMAQWVRSVDSRLPDAPSLVPELSTPKYRFDAAQRVVLEKKEDIKKRLGSSPDYADALALTFAQPVIDEYLPPARRGRW